MRKCCAVRILHHQIFVPRRAQLRDCLEILRSQVPFTDKLTTLSLLQSARKYIEVSDACVCNNTFINHLHPLGGDPLTSNDLGDP